MSFFTVLRQTVVEGTIEDSAMLPKIYRTQSAAIQALETDALAFFDLLVDPNSGDRQTFPGVQEIAANVFAFTRDENPDHTITYTLTEMEIAP
jgi:hypothetical protein